MMKLYFHMLFTCTVNEIRHILNYIHTDCWWAEYIIFIIKWRNQTSLEIGVAGKRCWGSDSLHAKGLSGWIVDRGLPSGSDIKNAILKVNHESKTKNLLESPPCKIPSNMKIVSGALLIAAEHEPMRPPGSAVGDAITGVPYKVSRLL